MLKTKEMKKVNRRGFLRTALVTGFALSAAFIAMPSAHADQLNDLRLSGAVGEAFDGYARARKESAKDFVISVNKQRRSIYVKRAKKQGVSAGQVGRVYAGQIAKKAPAGTWFLREDGEWEQKK